MFSKSVASISDNLEHICIFKFVRNYRISSTPHLPIILKKLTVIDCFRDDGQAIKVQTTNTLSEN